MEPDKKQENKTENPINNPNIQNMMGSGQYQTIFPNCGYCPCCGRPRGNWNYPINPGYPTYPYYPPHPYYPPYQVTCY